MKQQPDQSEPTAPPKARLSISVRELVEFVLRTGDLRGHGHLMSPARAWEGLRGHQRLQRSRPAAYQPEVPVSVAIETSDFILTIKGRIDGILQNGEQVLIEEIKTVLHASDSAPNPLHWAQIRIYAHLYLRQTSMDQAELQLTYLDLESARTIEHRQLITRAEASSFFETVTANYLEWVREHREWCRLRDQSIQSLTFPHGQYRPGQRKLAVASYRSLNRPGWLLAEAPTGIGKTISILFPALKALGQGRIARIFYLTAKSVTRSAPEKAVSSLNGSGLRVRTLSLTAQEKICFNGASCRDLTTCPFAAGYYDRIRSALKAGLQHETLNREVIQQLAQQFQVCPFALSLDLSLWVDVIICDYNYAFDPKVYLKRHFADESVDCAFLVDEAHNLVDRAREMFSAEISEGELTDANSTLRTEAPECARAVSRIRSAISKTFPQHEAANGLVRELLFGSEELNGHTQFRIAAPDSNRPAASGSRAAEVFARSEVPDGLLPPMRNFLEKAERRLLRSSATPVRDSLLQLYFRITDFLRVAETYDSGYITILENTKTSRRVRFYCLDPSRPLREAVQRARSVIFFSATLTPLPYFRAILGGDPGAKLLKLPSPFPNTNFRLLIQDTVGTSLRERGSSYDAVAASIAAVARGKRGNYLAYFPSYAYLDQVLPRFREQFPEYPVRAQFAGMAEDARRDFLRAFEKTREQTLIGFAVMGGLFGEGIDLVGERLVGAIVVGVGLPQICLERDLIRDFFQPKTGAGFDYAYTFPGMNRVLQAAGRVIRSETDRGVVLLIDSRFGQKRYQKLFPSWWAPIRVRDESEIAGHLAEFWKAPIENIALPENCGSVRQEDR